MDSPTPAEQQPPKTSGDAKSSTSSGGPASRGYNAATQAAGKAAATLVSSFASPAAGALAGKAVTTFAQSKAGKRTVAVLAALLALSIMVSAAIITSSVVAIVNAAQGDSLKDGASCVDSSTLGTVSVGNVSASADTGTGRSSAKWRQKMIFEGLVDSGWTAPQAAGMVGNIITESGSEPTRAESDIALNVNRGWGIVQWTFSRHTDIRNEVVSLLGQKFYTNQPSTLTDDEWLKLLSVQIDYINKELSGSHKVAGDMIRAATTATSASNAFLTKFEIPRDIPGNLPIRARQAEQVLADNAGYAAGSGGLSVTPIANLSTGLDGAAGGASCGATAGAELSGGKTQAVVNAALYWVGKTGYQMGAGTKEGGAVNGLLDCSGLMWTAYWKGAGVTLPRMASDQAASPLVKKVSVQEMRPGDMIFYAYGRKGPDGISHVAMYIGDGKIVETTITSTFAGTRIVPFEQNYAFRFVGRVIDPSADGPSTQQVANVSGDGMVIPIQGPFFVTSEYGMRVNPGSIFKGQYMLHAGIDLASSNMTAPILAFAAGTVTALPVTAGGGNQIVIQHDGYQTKYLHLSSRSVKVGDVVKPGQVIGTQGMTGNVSGPHLHFEVYVGGTTVNPRDFLKQRGIALPATR